MDSHKKKKEHERVREIIGVFIKHGIKDGIKTVSDPAKVRMALEDLGPTFIKIGQILSTRHDVLPPAFINEFKKLQDETKPHPFDGMEGIIEDELGSPLVEFFSYFEKEPFASASLAQVHRAVLKTGEEVAVKVLRPGIRETMLTDISLLRRLTFFIRLTLQGQVIDPDELFDDLEESVRNELDLTIEARNMDLFEKNNKEVRYVKSPALYEKLTTRSLLVQEYVHGIKIDNCEKLDEEGYFPDDIGTKLAHNYLKQIFEDGFFHADPHPGNLVISGGRIVYLDFGMMGRLNDKIKSHLFRFLQSIASRDMDSLSRSILSIARKKGKFNHREFLSEVEELFNTYIDMSLYEIDLPSLMEKIFKVCRKNNLAIPREVIMLVKGLITIEGLITRLSPEMNIMDVAVPYVRGRLLERRNLNRMVQENIENIINFASAGMKLPTRITELLNSLLAGKLTVRMEHSLERSVNQLNRMVNRLVFAIIVASLIMASSLLINSDIGPKMYQIPAIGLVGYIGAVIMGLWLIISILRSGKM